MPKTPKPKCWWCGKTCSLGFHPACWQFFFGWMLRDPWKDR